MSKIPDLAAIRDWCLSRFQAVGSYASMGDIPTQTSQLANDSGFVTNAVDDLENYYKKSETYTKSEINSAIPTDYLTSVPVATINAIGGVKPDGSTITIDTDGTIHAVSSQELAESVLGGES